MKVSSLRASMSYVAGKMMYDLLMFALIKDITVVAECPLVALEKFTTEGINNHLQSYLITSTRHVFVGTVSSLPYTDPISAHLYPSDSGLYIVMECLVQECLKCSHDSEMFILS